MNRAAIGRLYDHMEWADALVWRTVLGHQAAERDDYVLDGLFHLHLVQRAYLDVWTGEEGPERRRADFDGPAEMVAWARPFYPGVRRWLDELDEARLDEDFVSPWRAFIEEAIGAPPAPSTLGDTLYQVASHSGHHRAQINRRIREVGGEPRMIDYIGWVWRGCPGPHWV